MRGGKKADGAAERADACPRAGGAARRCMASVCAAEEGGAGAAAGQRHRRGAAQTESACSECRRLALPQVRHQTLKGSWVGVALVMAVLVLQPGRGQAQAPERRYYFCLGGELEGFACQGLADRETCGEGAWPVAFDAALRALGCRTQE
jgi:hypothetical protein